MFYGCIVAIHLVIIYIAANQMLPYHELKSHFDAASGVIKVDESPVKLKVGKLPGQFLCETVIRVHALLCLGFFLLFLVCIIS